MPLGSDALAEPEPAQAEEAEILEVDTNDIELVEADAAPVPGDAPSEAASAPESFADAELDLSGAPDEKVPLASAGDFVGFDAPVGGDSIPLENEGFGGTIDSGPLAAVSQDVEAYAHAPDAGAELFAAPEGEFSEPPAEFAPDTSVFDAPAQEWSNETEPPPSPCLRSSSELSPRS